MSFSKCCQADIGKKTEREYPTGGRTFYINHATPVCTECGEEWPEEAEENECI